MVWSALTISAFTEFENSFTPIPFLDVTFVLYDSTNDLYYYFEKTTDYNGVATLEESSVFFTATTVSNIRAQNTEERQYGSCAGIERENSRCSTSSISELTTARTDPSLWFVESEISGNGISSPQYTMSQTDGELIYEVDENGERVTMSETVVEVTMTNWQGNGYVSYWLYDSNNTLLKHEVEESNESSSPQFVIRNIPNSASKYKINAFSEDLGGNYYEYLNTTSSNLTLNSTNPKTISLSKNRVQGYTFIINEIKCYDTLFYYCGQNFGVYPTRAYLKKDNGIGNAVPSYIQMDNSIQTAFTGYCETRYLRFDYSGTNNNVLYAYESASSKVDIFSYLGSIINSVTLLMPQKQYKVELPVVYDSVNFVPSSSAPLPVYSLPNVSVRIYFEQWNNNLNEFTKIYNSYDTTHYTVTVFTISSGSISLINNGINKNWAYKCLSGNGGGNDKNFFKIVLTKNHYNILETQFALGCYPLNNYTLGASNTEDYLYVTDFELNYLTGELIPRGLPLQTYTITREKNAVFTRKEINDYVKGFEYEYNGQRGEKDVSLINSFYGTNYIYEEIERGAQGNNNTPNFSGFNITPTAKTPPSKTSFYSSCTKSLLNSNSTAITLTQYKSDFIDNLSKNNAYETVYALGNYEDEYGHNSNHCYVMDRTIYPITDNFDTNYFYIYNNIHQPPAVGNIAEYIVYWTAYSLACKTIKVKLEKIGNPDSISLQYRKLGEKWTDYNFENGSGSELFLLQNTYIQFRSKSDNNHFSENLSNYYRFVIDNSYKDDSNQTTFNALLNTYNPEDIGYDVLVGGFLSTLISSGGNHNAIVNNYCFCNLFSESKITGCEGVDENGYLSHLDLDLKTIPDYCYYRMFSGTPYLNIGPSISATTVGVRSMKEMFSNSNVSRLYKNKLYFTTATTACCAQMFQYSKFNDNFTINASTTNDSCFYSMFAHTTALTSKSIKFNNIQNFANSSCTYMFYSSTITKFPTLNTGITYIGNCAFREAFRGTYLNNIDFKIPTTATVGEEGCMEMFRGIQPSSPNDEFMNGLKLCASTKYAKCYYGMFQNAKNLKGSFVLPTNSISASGCMKMFSCATEVYCYSLQPTSLSNCCYESMFEKCKFRNIGGQWNSYIYPAPILPATTLKEECYCYMFKASNIDRHHNMYIPTGETLLEKPDKYVLKATNLPTKCYYGMYQDSQLKYVSSIITSALTTAGVSSCGHMFQNTPIFIDNRPRKISRTDGVDITLKFYKEDNFKSVFTRNGFDNMTCVSEDGYIDNGLKKSELPNPIYIDYNICKFFVLTSFSASLNSDVTLHNGNVVLTYSGNSYSQNKQITMQSTNNGYYYEFIDKNCYLLKSPININSDNLSYTVKFGENEYTFNGQTNGELMTDVNRIYYIEKVGQRKLISVNNKGYLMVRLADVIDIIGTFNVPPGNGNTIGNYLGYHPFIWIKAIGENIKFDNEAREFSESLYALSSRDENTNGYELPSWTKTYSFYEPGYTGINSHQEQYSLIYKPCPELVELNATTLAERCYEYMFSGCTNLYFGHNFRFGNLSVLSEKCFSHMFDSCINLRTITPDLMNITQMSASGCEYMYARCYHDEYPFRFIENTSGEWWDVYWTDVVGVIIQVIIVVIAAFLIYLLICYIPEIIESIGSFLEGLFIQDGCGTYGIGNLFHTTLSPPGLKSNNVSKIYRLYPYIAYNDYQHMFDSGDEIGIRHKEILGDICVGLNYITHPSNLYTVYNKQQCNVIRKYYESNGSIYIGQNDEYCYNLYYTTNGYGCTIRGNKEKFKETKVCLYEDAFTYTNDLYIWRFCGLNIDGLFDNTTATCSSLKYYNFPSSINNCSYVGMFEENSALQFPYIKLPELTADYCYKNMFNHCNNLYYGVQISTETSNVSKYSMQGMFKSCCNFHGEINEQHILPATGVASYCYESMFYMCYSMSAAPYLPAKPTQSINTMNCYSYMFYNACNYFSMYNIYVTFEKQGNQKTFVFNFVGNMDCIHLLYRERISKNISSNDYKWLIVDNNNSKTESDCVKNFEITFKKYHNGATTGETVTMKNKKLRAPDTLKFKEHIYTSNYHDYSTDVVMSLSASVYNIVNKPDLYLYDPENNSWKNYGSNNGYTLIIGGSGNTVPRYNMEKYASNSIWENKPEIFTGNNTTDTVECTQLSYIRADISKTALTGNSYSLTSSWVKGLLPDAFTNDLSLNVTGEYHGPAYNTYRGDSTIPTGWLTSQT